MAKSKRKGFDSDLSLFSLGEIREPKSLQEYLSDPAIRLVYELKVGETTIERGDEERVLGVEVALTIVPRTEADIKKLVEAFILESF